LSSFNLFKGKTYRRMIRRYVEQRPSLALLLHSLLLFLLLVGIQAQNVEKRRPMSYRYLNPRFRQQTSLLDMMMGDAPAAASCDGQKCENDGDCCSGSVCVSAGICVAHHGSIGPSQKVLGDSCDMGKSDDCGKGLCCTTQKRFRQKARDLCLPCLD